NPAAIYFLQLLWRNIISIGDIGEIINPIAEHGELMMHDPNGMNHYTFYLKTSVFNDTCFHHWDSRITTGSKYVGKFHPDLVQNGGLPINRHVCILQKIKRPDIVQSCRMVFMLVGIDDGIQIFDPLPKHLLPEVRASVYDQAFGAYLKVDGAPQAFIPEIQRATYLTVTAYDRNALRGARAQKSNFQSLSSVCCNSINKSWLAFCGKSLGLNCSSFKISSNALIFPSKGKYLLTTTTLLSFRIQYPDLKFPFSYLKI